MHIFYHVNANLHNAVNNIYIVMVSKDLATVVLDAARGLGNSLKPEQQTALLSLLSGRDVFVSFANWV